MSGSSNIVAVNYYWRKKCKDFAIAQIESSQALYRHRGESNNDKMLEDIIVGKLVEVAVYLQYKKQGCTKPDFNIYARGKKSFAADMTLGPYTLHVKGQGYKSYMNYGESYLFQKGDPLTKTPSAHDLIIVGLVCKKLYRVTLLASFKMQEVVAVSGLEQPKSEWYARTKYAIYLKNLRNKLSDMDVMSTITKECKNVS